MNGVERLKAICKERKIPISRLEKDLGFGNGYISQLKKGTFPYDRAVKIAEYLGVTVEYLVDGIEKTASPSADGLSDYDVKMLAWFHSLTQEQRKAILTLGGAPKELAEVLGRE